MKINIRKSWASSLPLGVVFTVLFAQALPTPAQEPRLTVEFGRRAEGYVAEMVQGNNGEVVISGEFEAPRHPRLERISAITVLDQAGRVRQRLAPPSLSVVRAVLPQGGYIISDNVGFPPQRVLTPDGAIDYIWEDRGYPSLTGQIAVHPNQGVLIARNPWDPDRFAAIERLDFQRQLSAYDRSSGPMCSTHGRFVACIALGWKLARTATYGLGSTTAKSPDSSGSCRMDGPIQGLSPRGRLNHSIQDSISSHFLVRCPTAASSSTLRMGKVGFHGSECGRTAVTIRISMPPDPWNS